VRIEFFGDEVESLRRFEVTPAQPGNLAAVDVTALAPSDDDREHFTGYLPRRVGWRSSSRRTSRKKAGTSRAARAPQDAHSVGSTLTQFIASVGHDGGIPVGSMETTCHLRSSRWSGSAATSTRCASELDAASAGQDCSSFRRPAEIERLEQIWANELALAAGCTSASAAQAASAVAERMRSSAARLFHRTDLHVRAAQVGPGHRQFSRTARRDYVVHLSHASGAIAD